MCWSAIGFPSFFLGFYLDAEKMVLFFFFFIKKIFYFIFGSLLNFKILEKYFGFYAI
jgi:hypothetical protein